jgi:hypothetical protein
MPGSSLLAHRQGRRAPADKREQLGEYYVIGRAASSKRWSCPPPRSDEEQGGFLDMAAIFYEPTLTGRYYIDGNPLRIAVSLLFALVGARLCQLKRAERLEAAIAGFQPARAMVDGGGFLKRLPDAPKMIVHHDRLPSPWAMS